MSSRFPVLVASYLSILLLSGALAACGSDKSNTGQIKLGITDAPVDSAQSVVIHVTSATLHGPDGDKSYDVVNPDTGTVGRDIDLLLLQSGQWTGLFNETVTAGHYSWIRLALDLEKSHIQIGDGLYKLDCTSCDNVGYRINSSFTVDADATLTLMLDFDLRKSITDPNNSGSDYILRPTVRLIDTAASGTISGSVSADLIASLGGSSPCSVYVFEGSDAQTDDVYIPMNGSVPGSQNNPVSTAKVSTDGLNTYAATFLPAGDYTLAVTCNAVADSAMTKDTLDFSASQNASVSAGSTTPVNFTAAP